MIALAVLLLTAPAEKPLLPGVSYTLPSNGLRVILSPDRTVPLVAVNVWYQVGSAHERPEEVGLAHLFEHLMFGGSRHVPAGKHYEVLRTIGAVDTNGTASLDRTNFFATVPRHQLETVLWLEADRMGFLELTADAFKRQRAAAVRDRRTRQNAVPYGPSNERMFQALFPPGHPYSSFLVGSRQAIERLTLDRAREFYRRHFVPANASIAIVGDFDPLEMKPLIDRWFSSLPQREAPERAKVVTLPLVAEKRVEVVENVEAPRTQLGWHAPKLLSRDDAVAEVYARLITSRSKGRIVAEQRSLEHVSVFTVTEFSENAESIDRFLAALQFTADEVNEATSALRLEKLQALQTYGYRADRLNHYARFAGDAGFIATDFARYAVSLDDIERFASTLNRNRRAVIRTVPAP